MLLVFSHYTSVDKLVPTFKCQPLALGSLSADQFWKEADYWGYHLTRRTCTCSLNLLNLDTPSWTMANNSSVVLLLSYSFWKRCFALNWLSPEAPSHILNASLNTAKFLFCFSMNSFRAHIKPGPSIRSNSMFLEKCIVWRHRTIILAQSLHTLSCKAPVLFPGVWPRTS